jgi:hypothetical protein
VLLDNLVKLVPLEIADFAEGLALNLAGINTSEEELSLADVAPLFINFFYLDKRVYRLYCSSDD